MSWKSFFIKKQQQKQQNKNNCDIYGGVQSPIRRQTIQVCHLESQRRRAQGRTHSVCNREQRGYHQSQESARAKQQHECSTDRKGDVLGPHNNYMHPCSFTLLTLPMSEHRSTSRPCRHYFSGSFESSEWPVHCEEYREDIVRSSTPIQFGKRCGKRSKDTLEARHSSGLT